MSDQQQPQIVQPSPLPLSVQVQRVNLNGAPGAVLQIHTAAGVGVYFMPAEMAKGVAQGLLQAATGLVVPVPNLGNLQLP